MKKISILLSVLILISCANENEIDELTIYTSRQPQLLEPIIEDFYDDTGIKVNLLSGNAQELMERIDIDQKRGLAVPEGMSIPEIYSEREPMYQKYCETILDGSKTIDQLVDETIKQLYE